MNDDTTTNWDRVSSSDTTLLGRSGSSAHTAYFAFSRSYERSKYVHATQNYGYVIKYKIHIRHKTLKVGGELNRPTSLDILHDHHLASSLEQEMKNAVLE